MSNHSRELGHQYTRRKGDLERQSNKGKGSVQTSAICLACGLRIGFSCQPCPSKFQSTAWPSCYPAQQQGFVSEMEMESPALFPETD